MKKETIDFGGVPKEIKRGGGSAPRVPEAEYEAKIIKVEKKWKDNDKSNAAYFNWQFQISAGEHKGAGPYYYTTSLRPEALFNLRNLIHAAVGKNVAGKSLAFDPETLIGKKVGIVMQDEEWKEKIRSKPQDVFPIAELESDDSDEVEEEEEEDEDLEEVDLDEL